MVTRGRPGRWHSGRHFESYRHTVKMGVCLSFGSVFFAFVFLLLFTFCFCYSCYTIHLKKTTHLHRTIFLYFTSLLCKFRVFTSWFTVIYSKQSNMPAPISQPQVDLASKFAGNVVVVGPGTMASQIHTTRIWMEISIPNMASEMSQSLCFDG